LAATPGFAPTGGNEVTPGPDRGRTRAGSKNKIDIDVVFLDRARHNMPQKKDAPRHEQNPAKPEKAA